jgi:hypothetical protein
MSFGVSKTDFPSIVMPIIVRSVSEFRGDRGVSAKKEANIVQKHEKLSKAPETAQMGCLSNF